MVAFPRSLRTALLTSCHPALRSSNAALRRPGQQLRSITNATKPDYIPSLYDTRRVDAKPGGWHPTLVHSSGEVKFTVIRLQPGGGEVPIHFHNKVWDYFMPLEGEAVIEVETKAGVKTDYEMKPGSFLAVGPGDVHRVKNLSEENEFVFFIAQAPRHLYDFVGKESKGVV